MVTRILLDDPSKGDMHNRQYITLGALWKAFLDYDMCKYSAFKTLARKAANSTQGQFTLWVYPGSCLPILQAHT